MLLGDGLGWIEGLPVGLLVGCTDGTTLGPGEGLVLGGSVETVGITEGFLVGGCDGLVVGPMLGCSDLSLGLSDGTLVGERVGLVVGTLVDFVGVSEGVIVGARVVGCFVGCPDGEAVGFWDGTDVGCRLGWGLGI